MPIRNLISLFAPNSVALIGASERPRSVGATVARNLVAAGFAGPIWFVNPKHNELQGRRCYPTVASLPEAPQLAVICTPPATVPALISELGNRGTQAAIVITAGLKAEGADYEAAMLAAAKPFGMRILGPNCIGLQVPGIGLDASFAHTLSLKGDLALVSQSGAIITAVLDWAKARGIGFSHLVSVGNMADIDVDDLLDYFALDPHVRSILLYLEGLKDARGFMSAARVAARSKPVIVLKSGRHPAAAKAAASHTGAMAGSDAVYDAAFERSGLVRVADLADLFEAAEVASRLEPLKGERLAVITNGGGAGVLAVDRLQDLGGALAIPSAETIASLDRVLPKGWSRANPLDIIGDAGPERYSAAVDAAFADPGVDAVLVLNCPTAVASSTEAAGAIVDSRAKAKAAGRAKPMLAAWLGAGAVAEGRRRLEAARIPCFDTPAEAVDGFMDLINYRRAQAALMRLPAPSVRTEPTDRHDAGDVIAKALRQGRSLLSEAESKVILEAYGIPVATTEVGRSPEEVEQIADRLIAKAVAGTRVVVKIWSHDISHKSDVGGVRLGLSDGKEARAAAEAIARRVAAARPDARIDGFMVQEMIDRPRAHELIVGIAEDATFGPIVLFGAGGTGVEVIDDKAIALPPLDRQLAHNLMKRTRISRLLAGYRDRPAADVEAIADVLVRIADMAAECPEIAELDINPLLADQHGVVALDARILVHKTAVSRDRFAIRPYPIELSRTVKLPSGLLADIRPVRPEDEHLYKDFFNKLDPEDVRLRMFTPMKEFTHALLVRMTQIDYARDMAFVAIEPISGDLLGVSQLSGDSDHDQAEYAVMVRSDLKGKGLGWVLMQELLSYARQEGFGGLYGHILAGNATMLKMCEELGFSVEQDPHDTGLKKVRLRLAPV